MTLRLDDDRYERLRNEAFARRVTQTDIIREALDAHFADYSTSPEYFTQSTSTEKGKR